MERIGKGEEECAGRVHHPPLDNAVIVNFNDMKTSAGDKMRDVKD